MQVSNLKGSKVLGQMSEFYINVPGICYKILKKNFAENKLLLRKFNMSEGCLEQILG